MKSFYQISEAEFIEIKNRFLISEDPLVIRQFPAQEKKKYALLLLIHPLFEPNRMYKETEVNDVIESVFHDYVTIRRMLIDYHLLQRTPDGRIYQKISLD